MIWIIAGLIGCFCAGWAFRFAGQELTDNKPFFRDMPLMTAFGYALGATLLIATIVMYFVLSLIHI